MKQQLWIANSSLLGIFVFALIVSFAFEQKPPKLRIRQSFALDTDKKTSGQAPVNLESIYMNDIFGTFVPQETRVSKQNFITPIPEPRAPAVVSAPEPLKQEFVPPLSIVLRGLIIASDETKSVAMIADETNIEEMYHLGDKLKDAHIVKIAHNRIVLLRANGQQEVFYLREDPNRMAALPEKWSYIVRQIDTSNFEIDPKNFMAEIDSLGALLESTPVIGTAYKEGKPIGIRIGTGNENNIGNFLGLQPDDLITAVNQIDVIEHKSRITAYEDVVKKNLGDTITISLLRQNQPTTLHYTLKTIKKPSMASPGQTTSTNPLAPPVAASGPGVAPGMPSSAPEAQPAQNEPNNLSQLQKREKRARDFSNRHDKQDNRREAVQEIRKRLLDNLRNRLQNRRVR